MATQTTNYNLSKPEATDPFSQFRQSYNDNMDIIDANLGGGGGSGGHTILDGDGNALPQEDDLQFTGNVSVTDDNVNGKTIVDILGGTVYGAFLDPDRVVYSGFTFDSSTHSWTATEDVILTDNMTPPDGSTAYFIRIDGKQVFAGYNTVEDPFVYVRKGQVVEYRAKSGSTMKAYGIKQGTNGIFAPVIYSDNERVIGVWRDNKPLYQKTIPFGVLPNATTKSVAHGINNLEYVANVVCTSSNGSERINVPFVNDNSVNSQLMLYITSANIVISAGSNRSDFTTTYCTIWYTKTTDVAGSGDWNTDGVPTVHYSTSEQVIGTWINSKPLYQKTVTFTAQSGGYQNVALGVSNADMMYISEAYIISNIETAVLSSYTGNVGNEEFQGLIAGLTTFDYRCGSDLNGGAGMVTVRYTKSTD